MSTPLNVCASAETGQGSYNSPTQIVILGTLACTKIYTNIQLLTELGTICLIVGNDNIHCLETSILLTYLTMLWNFIPVSFPATEMF